MNKVLKDLCVEIVSRDICTEQFNRLWIESGIPLEGSEFEIANLILSKSMDSLGDLSTDNKTLH